MTVWYTIFGGAVDMSEGTIFDKILAKELPADVVYEDDVVLAFKDISPVAPVHVLVLPKQRVSSIIAVKELDAEYLGRFLQAIPLVAKLCGVEEGGYRVVINHGQHGQETIDYLHAHIIGGKQLNWPPG